MVTDSPKNDNPWFDFKNAIETVVPGFAQHYATVTGDAVDGVLIVRFDSPYQKQLVETRLARQVDHAIDMIDGVERVEFVLCDDTPARPAPDPGDTFAEFYASIKARNGAIAYRREWRQIVGHTSGAILLQQVVYWWFHMGRKPFYKFVRPAPNNAAYTPGDSLSEETGFGRYELETSIKKIAPFVSTRRDGRKLTWWHVDEGAIIDKIGRFTIPKS